MSAGDHFDGIHPISRPKSRSRALGSQHPGPDAAAKPTSSRLISRALIVCLTVPGRRPSCHGCPLALHWLRKEASTRYAVRTIRSKRSLRAPLHCEQYLHGAYKRTDIFGYRQIPYLRDNGRLVLDGRSSILRGIQPVVIDRCASPSGKRAVSLELPQRQ